MTMNAMLRMMNTKLFSAHRNGKPEQPASALDFFTHTSVPTLAAAQEMFKQEQM